MSEPEAERNALVGQLQTELQQTRSQLELALEELQQLRTASSQNLELLERVQSSPSLQLMLHQVRPGMVGWGSGQGGGRRDGICSYLAVPLIACLQMRRKLSSPGGGCPGMASPAASPLAMVSALE